MGPRGLGICARGDSVIHAPAERDLLFGILAWQMDLVSGEGLAAALVAWERAPSRPLPDVLVAQGALRAEHRPLLESLIAAHLAHHDHDPRRAITALRNRL